MNIKTIYCEKDTDGNVIVSILVNGFTYISEYVELDNCTLGYDLPLNKELNSLHN